MKNWKEPYSRSGVQPVLVTENRVESVYRVLTNEFYIAKTSNYTVFYYVNIFYWIVKDMM